MQAAKAAVGDFVKHAPIYVQIGVVAFSDNGLAVQVPTADQGAVLAAIQRLTPQRGTSVAQGILASLNAIAVGNSGGLPPEIYSNLLLTPTPTPTPVPPGTYTNAAIILLSDGRLGRLHARRVDVVGSHAAGDVKGEDDRALDLRQGDHRLWPRQGKQQDRQAEQEKGHGQVPAESGLATPGRARRPEAAEACRLLLPPALGADVQGHCGGDQSEQEKHHRPDE